MDKSTEQAFDEEREGEDYANVSKQLGSKLATRRETTRQRRSCRRKDKLKEGRNSTAQRERNES